MSPALCTAAAVHRFGDKAADALSGFGEMAVGHVCIACRGAVAEQLAHQGQVLTSHDRLAGGGMPKVTQAKPAELRILADHTPATAQRVVALPTREAREEECLRLSGTGQGLDSARNGFSGAIDGRPVFQ